MWRRAASFRLSRRNFTRKHRVAAPDLGKLLRQAGAKVKVINRHSAEHYIWGQKCDGWHLVKESTLSVIQERMPPATNEVLHFHQKAQQFFFILSGEGIMELNGEQVSLHPGQGVHVPPGVAHQIQNCSNSNLEFLVISQPPSHGDRFSPEAFGNQ